VVNPTGFNPSTNIQFQQVNSPAQQEARARNEQTQPRNAPAADSQTADQRSLRSRDEDRKQNAFTVSRRQDQAQNSNAQDNRRGQLLDVTA